MTGEMTEENGSSDLDTDAIDEFADYTGELTPFHAEFAWSRLFTPASIRGLVSLAGGLIFLFSDRSTEALALILAIVLVVWAFSEYASPQPEGRIGRLITAIVLASVGVALLFWPDATSLVISRLLGGGIMYAALRDLVVASRARKDSEVPTWALIRGIFIFAVGASLWLAPGVMLGLVITVFATFWIIAGLATIVGNFTGMSEDIGVMDVWPQIFRWLESRPHTADDRTQLYDKLFYEGPLAPRRLSRFFLLMGFATTISTFGVISDSTAVVIGAMLVAPLMTPLMGTSLSLIMGWPKRAAMSAGVALVGIMLAIGMSVIFGAMLPFEIDPANSQVASRVAPTMVDLVIAVAAGGAGAFALSRPDVSDALPGVAVSIALVPPLSVVGLMLEGGHPDEAFGALMLFTTNLVAILLVGALVFLLTGVVPVTKLVTEREWIRNMTTLIGILAIGVIVALGTTGEQIRAEAFDRDNVNSVVDEWVADQSLTVVSVEVGPDAIDLIVVGHERPADVEDLGSALEAELDRKVVLTVRWVPEERFVVGDDG